MDHVFDIAILVETRRSSLSYRRLDGTRGYHMNDDNEQAMKAVAYQPPALTDGAEQRLISFSSPDGFPNASARQPLLPSSSQAVGLLEHDGHPSAATEPLLQLEDQRPANGVLLPGLMMGDVAEISDETQRALSTPTNTGADNAATENNDAWRYCHFVSCHAKIGWLGNACMLGTLLLVAWSSA